MTSQTHFRNTLTYGRQRGGRASTWPDRRAGGYGRLVDGACCNLPSVILAPTGEILATTTNYFDQVTAEVNLDCALSHFER